MRKDNVVLKFEQPDVVVLIMCVVIQRMANPILKLKLTRIYRLNQVT